MSRAELPQTARLLALMARLRDPDGGCPWDQAQTYGSIVPHTLEEAYEVADAIERGNFADLEDELGDLLFQVIFYSQIATEENRFDFESVAGAMADKIERRHPHVFGDTEYTGERDLKRAWEQQKHRERSAREPSRTDVGTPSLLDELPRTLPALPLAQKIQKRVGRHGFDWPDIEGVFDKLEEEIAELKASLKDGDPAAVEEEFGDLLFTCVNLARHLNVDAEASLRRASRKFEARFRQLEVLLAQNEQQLEDASLEQLDRLWRQVKDREPGRDA